MARTEHIKSARKTKDGSRPTCYTCNQPIAIGDSYNRNQPSRFSRAYCWHAACKAPAPSVLESNEKRSMAMAAFEQAAEDLAALDAGAYSDSDALLADVRSVLEQCAEGVREAAEAWNESADSIEDGFGHETYQSAEMREHADTYEGVAYTVEQIYLDDWSGDAVDEPFAEWAQGVLDAAQTELDAAEGDID